MLELIQQENKKIEPNLDFDINRFKDDTNARFVLFYYDETIKRNKFDVIKVSKCSAETMMYITEHNYRGDVDTSVNGVLPLFVVNFPYPLYGLSVKYRKIVDGFDTYLSIKSPITFKLKGKEDRLCYDVHIKEYSDITNMCNDEFLSSSFKKAMKLEIPNI